MQHGLNTDSTERDSAESQSQQADKSRVLRLVFDPAALREFRSAHPCFFRVQSVAGKIL